jgi:hypothetical protein
MRTRLPVVLAVLVALPLALGMGCAGLANLGTIDVVDHVRQEDPRGCVVAAVAMAAKRTYRDVDVVRVRLGMNYTPEGGLVIPDMLTLAGAMGVRLVLTESVNLVTDRGLLVVRWLDGTGFHVVYLYRGLVYDPLEYAPKSFVYGLQQWEPYAFLRQD